MPLPLIAIGQVEHLTVGTSLWMDPRMEGGVSKWTPDGSFFGHLTRIIRQLAARRARKNWDFGLKIVDLMNGNTSYGAQTPKIFLALRAATLLFGIFDLQGKYLIFLAAEGGENFLGLLTKINRRRRRRKIFGVLDPRMVGGGGCFEMDT